MTMTWRWFGFAALWLLASCGSARGPSRQEGGGPSATTCEASVLSWAARCASRQSLDVAAVQCPEENVVLLDLRGEPELRVELQHSPGPSFRRMGSWGVSPVGDFADWNQVARSMRDRFDKVTACALAEEIGRDASGSVRSSRPAPLPPNALTVGNSVPWLLLAALACALASLWPARRSVAWRRRLLAGSVLALGTLALRSLLLPTLFFHQNGQGPLWVSALVSPQHHPYGPGYRAVFGWLRWFVREPDRGVFFVQGVLASLSVPCAAFIARRLGASRALAGALALAVAVDPILGRLSRSESYYGVGSSLLFVATALLAAALTAPRMRSPGFALPAVAAGLVIAQHALVHPVGWLAAALCPAVLLLGPGHWRRRVRRTAAALLIVAAVVAVLAAPAMVAVIRSPFGSHWMGDHGRGFQGFARLRHVGPGLIYVVLLAAAVGASARSKLRGALQALVLVAAFAVAVVADAVGFGVTVPWVHQAYLRLYAPVAVVLAASTLLRLPRSRAEGRALAGAVALASVLFAAAAWPAWTKAPTDALEQEVVRGWRRGLSAGQVAYLERSGQRIQVLPFYRGGSSEGAEPLILRAGEFAEDITRQGRRPFYVHTSLCSTAGGREFCDRIEQRYQMTRLREVILPAVPSMVGFAYDAPTVRVTLYRVNGPSPTAP